jgi:hypothetical protein
VSLIIYTTIGCHLCELAEAEIGQVYRQLPTPVTPVDIAKDERLINRYGMRIPVLYNRNTGAELDWPFSAKGIMDWIASQ